MSVFRVHDMDESFLVCLRIVICADTLPCFSHTFHSLHTSSQSCYDHPLPSGMTCSVFSNTDCFRQSTVHFS